MNWRSPLPPAGKRLKMDIDSSEDDSDTEDEDFVLLTSSDEIDTAGPRSSNNISGKLQLSPGDSNGGSNGEDSAVTIYNNNINNDDHENPDDGDNDDGSSIDEESIDENRSLTVRTSDSNSDASSGYSGGLMFFDIDDGDEDNPIDYGRFDSDLEDGTEALTPEEYLKFDPTPETQYPKPDWITLNELRQRKYGLSSSKQIRRPTNMYWFERYANNSLWMIQRLELSQRLEGHARCVNSLDFNSNGSLLCSGSDDLRVTIWDWQSNKLVKGINTGHNNNVFQSQFCNSNQNIITASRDGTVRYINIETGRSELIMTQSGEIGKLAFITPDTLVTCGTNASVNLIDLRTRDATKLFIVRNPRNNRTCELHTIETHPIDKHKIVVAGASPYVFLYDLRRARDPNDQQHKPYYVLDKFKKTNNIVTSTAFNSIGENLLISYNDDDLFVCRTDTGEVTHRYTGHRNKKTIKGCAWFGDNFVLSGSDDGHIYGWDLQSEHIVCFLDGDRKGVVNCLCVHPTIPILASSGLDHDVKIWEPTSSVWPQTLKGIKPHICKNTIKRKRAKNFQNRVFRSPNYDDDEIDSDSDNGVEQYQLHFL